MADNLKGPSTRRIVVLLVEYDSLTNPDEVARIQAESATLYEGVATAAAKTVTPEKAQAIRTLLADRGPFAEFVRAQRIGQPMAAHACENECQPFPVPATHLVFVTDSDGGANVGSYACDACAAQARSDADLTVVPI